MEETARKAIETYRKKKDELENKVIQEIYLLGAKYLVVYVCCPSFNDGDPCIPSFYCAIDSIPRVLLEDSAIRAELEEDEFLENNNFLIYDSPYGKLAFPTHKTPKEALYEFDVGCSLMCVFDLLKEHEFPEVEFSDADELLDLKVVKNCEFNTVTLLKFTETGLKSIGEISLPL